MVNVDDRDEVGHSVPEAQMVLMKQISVMASTRCEGAQSLGRVHLEDVHGKACRFHSSGQMVDVDETITLVVSGDGCLSISLV